MAAAESSSVVSAEALTCTLCLSSENRAYSRKNKSWLYFVCSLGDFFCMAANGIREEYLFPNASVSVLQAAHSAGINN